MGIPELVCPYCSQTVSKGHKVHDINDAKGTDKGVDIKILHYASQNKGYQIFYLCVKKNRIFAVGSKTVPEFTEGLIYHLTPGASTSYDIVTDASLVNDK